MRNTNNNHKNYRYSQSHSNSHVCQLSTSNQLKREQIMRLHRNLGHISKNALRLTLAIRPIMGLTPQDVSLMTPCKSCKIGKARRTPHAKKAKRVPTKFGQHLHADNTGDMVVNSRHGKKILCVIVDKFSGWIFVKPLRSKQESVDTLRYITRQELNGCTEMIRTDQGGEWMNHNMGNLLETIGAKHETSCTQNSQQNGTAEKAIQDIMNDVRTLLDSSGLPLSFWGYAAKFAAFTKNRRPKITNPDSVSPYFLRYNRHPDLSRMQPFGQWGVIMHPKGKFPLKKLGNKGLEGRLIGYDDDDGTKGYNMYFPDTKTTTIGNDVTFLDEGTTRSGMLPDVQQLFHSEENQFISHSSVTTEDENISENTDNTSTPNLTEENFETYPSEETSLPTEEKSTSYYEEENTDSPSVVEYLLPREAPEETKSLTHGKITSENTPNKKTTESHSPAKVKINPKSTKPTHSPVKRRQSRRIKDQAVKPKWVPPKHRKILQTTEALYSKGGKTDSKTSPKINPKQPIRKSTRIKQQKETAERIVEASMIEASIENNLNIPTSDQLWKSIMKQKHNKSLHCEVFMSNADTSKAADTYTPGSHSQAMNCPDKFLWEKAVKRENQSLKDNEVYEKINKTEIPTGTNLVSGRWVFKVKPDGNGNVKIYKGRIVARGFEAILGLDYDETYAPVASVTSIRLILCIATSLQLSIRAADFSTAFLNAKLEKPIYLNPPPGTDCGKDQVWKLKRALYGLPNSPMLWNSTLVCYLIKIGFIQSKQDPCVFFKITSIEYTLLCVVVDDLLICSNKDEFSSKLIQILSKRFKIKDLGQPEYVIGIHLKYDRKNKILQLNQKLYIENMVNRFGQKDSQGSLLPADPYTKLRVEMDSPPSTQPYRSIVGSLLYATITRPDIATIVSQLSRYLNKPQQAHWNAAIRTLRYLKTTKDKTLVYKPSQNKNEELKIYTDSSWNNNPDNSRSRSGYIITFNNCMINWKSKLQPIVALSSAEAEYIALCDAGKEAIWLKRFIQELKFNQSSVQIFIDNQSAIQMSKHHMVKPRTKHIALRYHWIREQILNKQIILIYIPTDKNIADTMTKNLNKQKFFGFFEKHLK